MRDELIDWCRQLPVSWPDMRALPRAFDGWTSERIGALEVFDRPASGQERLRVCVWALAHPDEPPGAAAAIALLRAPMPLAHVSWSVCVQVDEHAARNAGWVADPRMERYAREHWRPSSDQDVEQGMPVDRFPLLHATPLGRSGDLARWLRRRAPHLAVALHADALAGDHLYSSAQPPDVMISDWRAVSQAFGCPVHRGWPLAGAAPWGHTDVFAEPTLSSWLAAVRARHGRIGDRIVHGPVPVSVYLQTLPQPARMLTLETGIWRVPGLDDERLSGTDARAEVRAAVADVLTTMEDLGAPELPDWPARRAWLRALRRAAPHAPSTVAQQASLQRLRVLSLWCAGEALRAGILGAEEILERQLAHAHAIMLADPHAGARSLLGRLMVTCARLSA